MRLATSRLLDPSKWFNAGDEVPGAATLGAAAQRTTQLAMLALELLEEREVDFVGLDRAESEF